MRPSLRADGSFNGWEEIATRGFSPNLKQEFVQESNLVTVKLSELERRSAERRETRLLQEASPIRCRLIGEDWNTCSAKLRSTRSAPETPRSVAAVVFLCASK